MSIAVLATKPEKSMQAGIPMEGLSKSRIRVEQWRTGGEDERFCVDSSRRLTLLRARGGEARMSLVGAGKAVALCLGAQEILVIPPETTIATWLGRNSVWQAVSIPEGILTEVLAQGVSFLQFQLSIEDLVVEAESTTRLLEALGEEAGKRGLASDYAMESLARLVVVEVVRQLEPKTARVNWVSIPPRQLRSILAFIEANLNRELPLSELAAIYDWSPYHFCRIFKRAMGVTPHQYVMQRRVERAKELLEQGTMNLAGVALEAGFGSQSHFGTIFRRMTGCTPKQFRHAAA